ncbi:hypothetical protein A9Q61_12615 [Yersinia ruckeri]|uniref:DUF1133 family protein n=1 Tax=Yersinia ruckeri TaxID=29486 RepID=UPI0008FE77BC|nr:DUF1133 family protein [Yersinia ruckeri]OJB84517.1 hypothetical protein A9Q61_12615 [Yersinia ruckeri]
MKSNVWHELAKAPRRSYLGKLQRITPVQDRWVRSVLNMWGQAVGGDTAPTGSCGVIGRLMIVSAWDENKGASIVKAVEDLHKLGYRGTELFQKAKEIINPRNSFSNLFARANEGEEAAFVDQVVLKAFTQSNPIRAVAIQYYCERKDMQEIACYLNRVHAPHLTLKQCIDRIRWCREIFNATLFHLLRSEVEKENLLISA